MANVISNVPEWAKVSKDEYRQLRNELRRTTDAASFDFVQVWNLMIETMEERHALVAKGRRKNDLTLAQAVGKMQQDVIKERADIMQEAVRAQEHAEAMAAVAS
jgi:hypothetical protein